MFFSSAIPRIVFLSKAVKHIFIFQSLGMKGGSREIGQGWRNRCTE